MKNRLFKTAMAGVLSLSMVFGMAPVTAMAADAAADGSYTGSATVYDVDGDFYDYDIDVAFTVENGTFADIQITSEIEDDNSAYVNKALNGNSKVTGMKEKLEGQAASVETIEGVDTVSGATCTSSAIKEAMKAALSGTAAKDLSEGEISLSKTSFTYSGKVQVPSVTVTCGGSTLTEGTDYTVAYSNASSKAAGSYTVTVTGTGSYTGTLTGTYKIVPKKVSGAAASCSGKTISVTWDKSSGASCYLVYRSVDGASYKKVAKVTDLAYSDTDVANGSKYSYKIYAADKSAKVKASASSAVTCYFLTKPTAKVSNSAAGKMTVSYGKNAKATGYEIQYGTKSSFSGAKTVTIKSYKTVSKVIKATKGKTYYVRVRAYKTVSGTTYYSDWSAKKSVKISK